MRKVMINYNRGLEHYIEKYAISIERVRTAKMVGMINSLGKRSVHNAHEIGCVTHITAGIGDLGAMQKNICQEGQG
jgi:hypothetical protein